MNLTKTTLLGAVALLFVGCSNAQEDTIYNMYDALGDGDIEALSESTTEPTLALLTMGAMMKCSINKTDYSSQEEIVSACMENTFGNTDVKNVEITETSENRAYAMVTVDKDGKTSTEKLNLIKDDDGWKVNISK